MSKRSIVLLFHGSRAPQALVFEEHLAAEVVRKSGGAYLSAEVAHLESAPLVGDAVACCAQAGAREVVVVPMFLAPGAHAMADVPRLIAQARLSFPALSISVTDFIGRHPALVDAIVELGHQR